MKVLGLSPLDKDATVALVEDGDVLFAAAEERFSRIKQHAGFPWAAIEAALRITGTRPEEIDVVAYAFHDAATEARLMRAAFAAERERAAVDDRAGTPAALAAALLEADARVPDRSEPIHGLHDPNQRIRKGWFKHAAYRLAGTSALSSHVARRFEERWLTAAMAEHRQREAELLGGLATLGWVDKLRRFDHHGAHAAGAYLASGFDRALVLTLDGYGSGLAGSVSLGEGGKLRRLAGLRFPNSLGTFYEMVTSSLGFHPDRHAGKVVGLAAYGDPSVLRDVLATRCRAVGGEVHLDENLNVFLSRHLASRYPMIDVAAAYQDTLETLATAVLRHWIARTGCDAVVLSGGVSANVKMNQRLHAVEGVTRIFVDPDMGDGGCGAGLGLALTREVPRPWNDVYLGPSFEPEEIRVALREADLSFTEPGNLAAEVAAAIHAGRVVGRFDGRMEYGPRALGNRSILYHAREPEVNHWLNQRLGRTEFMPFAPVTLWDHRQRCYEGLDGAELAAQFMTVTFDCTPWMREHCPAAVHVDGTARPQLLKREVNPGYFDILTEYEQLSGVPCLVNTSFNMHEEPIVCTPADAIAAFLDGRLDVLAIGPCLVQHPDLARAGTGRGA